MRRLALTLALIVSGCDGGGPADAGVDAGAADAFVPPPPLVETSLGPVEGTAEDGARAFLGIPFAAPPVGDLRWRPPQPPDAWTEPLAAVGRPPRCTQQALGLELSSSEDCLYLNVHTPDPAPEAAPVMVWMHGGAFIFGEGLQTDDGTAGDLLARDHGVVVVSMNYRLGTFGFMAHPALTVEGEGTSGNYGLMDQRMALEWVRDNIAAFGGDPDNVTIFGESAGGMSVCLHMVSPQSQGLFHRVISQSGLCDTLLDDRAAAEAAGEAFVTAAGCDGEADPIACMRAISGEELLAADAAGREVIGSLGGGRAWWPIVDGVVVPAQLRERAAAGEVADVPTILGWNADEGTLFILLAEEAGETVDEAAYRLILGDLASEAGLNVDDVLAQYPLADYPDPGAAVADALGHFAIACPSRRAAGLFADAGVDVRVYRFAYPDARFQLPADRELGAFHSAEIQYVFGHPAEIGRRSFLGDDRALHEAMSGYWTRFAAGDPDAAGAPAWPAYDRSGDAHLVLDRTIEAGTGSDAAPCVLWD